MRRDRAIPRELKGCVSTWFPAKDQCILAKDKIESCAPSDPVNNRQIHAITAVTLPDVS